MYSQLIVRADETLAVNRRLRAAMINLRAEPNALLITYPHHRYPHLSGASGAAAQVPPPVFAPVLAGRGHGSQRPKCSEHYGSLITSTHRRARSRRGARHAPASAWCR